MSRATTPAGDEQQLLVEYLDPAVPWAIRPSALEVIVNLARSRAGINAERAREHLALNAQSGDTRTAGAVAIIPLRGILTPRPSLFSIIFGGGTGLEAFRENFREAAANDDIGSILIDVDSPGGTTELIAETAAEIRAARGTKPIIAVANTMAASAAYWIAAQADELLVTPSGLVGSIGIYTIHQDWSGFNEQLGVIPTYVSAGKFKTEGNEDEPLSAEARAAIQETVDDYYSLFVADVAAGRRVSEQQVRDGFGEGRVLPAQRALAAGMVDRVATFDEAVHQLVASPPGAAGGGAVALAQAVAAGRITNADHRRLLGLPADASDEDLAAVWDERAAAVTPEQIAAFSASNAEPPPEGGAPPPGDREAAPPAVPAWLLLPTPRR